MNKTTFMKVALSFIGATLFVSCTDFYMDIPASEQYTRSFIKEFGVPDPEHDWNMATEGTVTVNVGDKPADVKIYAKYGEKYYLVADLENIKGQFDVPFDMPKECTEVMLNVNGAKFYGNIGGKIDCSDHPARQPKMSRANEDYENYVDTQDYSYSADDPFYSIEKKGVTITTSAPTTNPYIYFNAQQMAPILQKEADGAWPDYWSMTNDGEYRKNPGGKYTYGILPESSYPSDPNKPYNLSYTQGNAYHHQEDVTQDFVYMLKDPEKGFDIYPMFYGTNMRHRLGIYLIDVNGEPYRDSQHNIVKYPIYESKHGDDIQISKPIKDFYVGLLGGQTSDYQVKPLVKNRVVGAYVITMTTGEPSYKLVLDFGDNVPESFTTEIKDDSGGKISISQDKNDSKTFLLSAGSPCEDQWAHIYVTVNGKTGDLALKVTAKTVLATTNVKRIDICDGDRVVSGSNPFEIGVGQTKTFTVKCYDSETGGTVITDPNLKIVNWSNGGFETSLNGQTLTVTGKTEGTDQWLNAYIDLDKDGYKDDDEINAGLNVKVVGSTTHTYTQPFNEWPSPGTVHDWNYYFITSNFSSPRREATEDVVVWSGSESLNDSNFDGLQDHSKWTGLKTGHTKLKIEYTATNGQLLIVSSNSTKDYWMELHTYTDLNSGVLEIDLDEEFTSPNKNVTTNIRTEITTYGLKFKGSKITLTKISLVGSGSEDPTTDPSTPQFGSLTVAQRNAATADLVKYYDQIYPLEHACDAAGHNGDVTLKSTDSDVEVSVTIASTATQENCSYTVTLTKIVLNPATNSSSAPRRGSKKTSSRAAGDRSEWDVLISDRGALYHDNNTQWFNIRKGYNEVEKTTNSYDFEDPLLVKSKGFHVDVLDENGNPWQGYFGMYIDYFWGEDFELPDGSVNENWEAIGTNHWGRPKQGTHYSQSELNILEYNGVKYPISYAATFKHPMSENKYLCFEDWDVTAPNGDISLDGTTTGNVGYNDWSWKDRTGDYSSDRDLNDIIYRQVGLIETRTTEIKNQAKGFSWIWALEDLGSTDDFDFNDVVMRIESITTTKTNSEDPDHPIIAKRIVLTPRCAGGTLPIYIHFAYDQETDYVLKPGVFDLTTNNHGLSQTGGWEFHEWFEETYSDNPKMLNTGASSNGKRVAEGSIHSCTLIVPTSYKLNYMPAPGINDTQNHTQEAYTVDGYNTPFYVTVKGPKVEYDKNGNELIDQNRLGAYKVGLPTPGTPAAQSFIIVEQKEDSERVEDSEGHVTSSGTPTTYAKPWYWPKERAHILDAYPQFKDWVQDHKKSEWYLEKNSNQEYLYK